VQRGRVNAAAQIVWATKYDELPTLFVSRPIPSESGPEEADAIRFGGPLVGHCLCAIVGAEFRRAPNTCSSGSEPSRLVQWAAKPGCLGPARDAVRMVAPVEPPEPLG
jgi:hypothetical protein